MALAAELSARLNEINRQFSAKKLDRAVYNETSKILEVDLARLTKKWQDAGKENQFLQALRQREAAARQPRRLTPSSAPPPPTRTVMDENPLALLLGTLFVLLVVVGGVHLLFLLFRQKPPEQPPLSDNYGTADFAPLETKVADKNCVTRGVFLGKSSTRGPLGRLDAPGAPVCSAPEHHTLIVARTRSGKGTRVIIPTLLRYAGSALVIDPKGENGAVTARTRRDQLGQKVFVVNPWNELAETYESAGFSSATYNPLDILDRNDPNAVAIAQTFAQVICPTVGDRKDPFWQGNAASLLTGVLLWLAEQPGEKKTLARTREITSLNQQDFTTKHLAPMAVSTAFTGAIREMAAQFVGMDPRTYIGIVAELNQNMRFLSDPQIKTATATSSFSMADLIKNRTTVYLVIPTDRIDTQKTWLRLVLAAGMHTFKRFPMRQRPGHRCLFLIDEFGSLGRLDNLPGDLAYMSNYGLDLTLIVQGLDQLKTHYGDARDTILNNCDYKWFCNIGDLNTAKWLSESLGRRTVRTRSTSKSESHGDRSSSTGDSVSEGEMGRLLFEPNELLTLQKDVAIAMNPKGKPYLLRPVDYWNLEGAFGTLRRQHSGLFWKPPMKFDPNPCHMEQPEEGDVFVS